MVTISDLEGALHLVLEASATEHGLSSGWQQRQVALSPRQFVQTLVFGFLEDPHATLSHLARVAHVLGALVTQQALSQRFSARSVAPLSGVVQDALGLLVQAEPVAAPICQGFPGGVFLDAATQIAWHDDWAEVWPACGTCSSTSPSRWPSPAASARIAINTRLLPMPVPLSLLSIRPGDEDPQAQRRRSPASSAHSPGLRENGALLRLTATGTSRWT